MAVNILTASAWAAGGTALKRLISGERTRRVIGITLGLAGRKARLPTLSARRPSRLQPVVRRRNVSYTC